MGANPRLTEQIRNRRNPAPEAGPAPRVPTMGLMGPRLNLGTGTGGRTYTQNPFSGTGQMTVNPRPQQPMIAPPPTGAAPPPTGVAPPPAIAAPAPMNNQAAVAAVLRRGRK